MTIHDDDGRGGRTASAFMFLQSDTQIEGSSTESADVLLQLLLSNLVDLHVTSDLGGLGRSIGTEGAFVRLLIRVAASMDDEIRASILRVEDLSTEFTREAVLRTDGW